LREEIERLTDTKDDISYNRVTETIDYCISKIDKPSIGTFLYPTYVNSYQRFGLYFLSSELEERYEPDRHGPLWYIEEILSELEIYAVYSTNEALIPILEWMCNAIRWVINLLTN